MPNREMACASADASIPMSAAVRVNCFTTHVRVTFSKVEKADKKDSGYETRRYV